MPLPPGRENRAETVGLFTGEVKEQGFDARVAEQAPCQNIVDPEFGEPVTESVASGVIN